MPVISKITLPSGGNPYDLRDNASMHFLGKTTTDVTAATPPTTVVIDGNNIDVKANDVVLYGNNNQNYLYNGSAWVLLSESASQPNDATVTVEVTGETDQTFTVNQSSDSTITIPVPVKDAKVDGTSILNTSTHTVNLATTGSYDGDSTSHSYNPISTKDYVDTAISNLPSPMVFKGTLGAQADSPTITVLPTDGSANVGDTYKVITAGTYGSQTAKVGDLFICLTKTASANTWTYVPSGDEPSGTVTNVAAGVGLTTASGSAITDTGTIKAKLTSETALTGDGVASVGVDGSGNLAVDIRVVEGTYNASTNKVATQSTVANAINALDGGTIGTPSASKTVTALSQSNGNINATFSDISIPISQVNNVSATTTIHNPTKVTVAKTIATAAPTDTAPDNQVTWCSVSNETLNLYKIGYTTGDSITTSDVSNVVVKSS